MSPDSYRECFPAHVSATPAFIYLQPSPLRRSAAGVPVRIPRVCWAEGGSDDSEEPFWPLFGRLQKVVE
ncbi:MAG: hypothetical protein ABJJ14_17495 [Cyclobacteriaceae bacterium]